MTVLTKNHSLLIPISTRRLLTFLSPLLLAASLAAEDRKPADSAAPPNARVPAPAAPRGERQPGADPVPGRTAEGRSEWPEELKLTDDQLAKLKEVSASLGAKLTDLAKKRDSILTDEQKTAQSAAMQKAREGNLSRQEAAEAIAAATQLTPEQKTQLDALELEARDLSREWTTQKMSILTDDQRATLRKLTIAAGVVRSFTIPGGVAITDEQKASLKSLQDELGGKLADLTEKQATLLTDERRAARDAAMKEARDSGKDRQAAAAAIEAALKMTDAEKAQLLEAEQGLRDLNQQIRDRVMALLTPEQKAELEKKFGAGRARN